MKVLLLNGSPNEAGCTFTALKEIAQTLAEFHIDSEILQLGKQTVSAAVHVAAETVFAFLRMIQLMN